MHETENKALTLRWFQEVWNRRDARLIDELLAEGVVLHGPDGDLVGREEFATYHAQMLKLLPEMRVEVLDLIADGEKVAVRVRMTGIVDTGASPGALPVSPLQSSALVLVRWRDGKVVESWHQSTMRSALEAVGAPLPDYYIAGTVAPPGSPPGAVA